MRVEYEMTEEDFKQLAKLAGPWPAMFLSGGQSMFGDPQENANRAWASLGRKYGFEPMSVQPVRGKSQRFFTAERLQKESKTMTAEAKSDIEMAEETTTATETADEATLKSEIKALEKKIENKQAHIERLQGELKELKDEQRALKVKRVKLLQSELEPELES